MHRKIFKSGFILVNIVVICCKDNKKVKKYKGKKAKNERIRQLLNKMENNHNDLNNKEKRKTE